MMQNSRQPQEPQRHPGANSNRQRDIDRARDLGRQAAALKRQQRGKGSRAIDRVLAENATRKIEAELNEIRARLTAAPAARMSMAVAPQQIR